MERENIRIEDAGRFYPKEYELAVLYSVSSSHLEYRESSIINLNMALPNFPVNSTPIQYKE